MVPSVCLFMSVSVDWLVWILGWSLKFSLSISITRSCTRWFCTGVRQLQTYEIILFSHSISESWTVRRLTWALFKPTWVLFRLTQVMFRLTRGLFGPKCSLVSAPCKCHSIFALKLFFHVLMFVTKTHLGCTSLVKPPTVSFWSR